MLCKADPEGGARSIHCWVCRNGDGLGMERGGGEMEKRRLFSKEANKTKEEG